ncbi:hypothetical protein BST79_gp242 [Only Syngen Nebraska virus 5]|uniref:hypothetical protein n=1 Tax=Only Syngen Nebraska virus 5 TaxID=1917232 RepID=UPI000901A21F|nr:hypothetical protein BST79_gp242 [Only Syngen Nebraska virus 5]APC25755.1 hypothetical protein [Only Syngen Nebraska virus 5]
MIVEPYLCVYASQGAACIGENKHKKICDAVETFWERASSEGYRAALRRNHILTNDEIIERLEKNHPKIADLIRIAGEDEESSTDVANKYNRLISEFAKYANANYISAEYCRVIDDALRKTTYTTYGNAQEEKVFNYIRDTLGIDCVEDSTFYKMQAGTIVNEYGSFPWYIGGKIDAINRDRTTLIEIKNRVNRLFKHLPSYEMIQVQTYLQLLNLDKAILVECMKTKESNVMHSDVNVVSVNKDDVYWEMEILPKLEGFVDFISRIIHDEKLQDKFLVSKRRSAIVSFHITSYVRKKREDKTNKSLGRPNKK